MAMGDQLTALRNRAPQSRCLKLDASCYGTGSPWRSQKRFHQFCSTCISQLANGTIFLSEWSSVCGDQVLYVSIAATKCSLNIQHSKSLHTPSTAPRSEKHCKTICETHANNQIKNNNEGERERLREREREREREDVKASCTCKCVNDYVRCSSSETIQRRYKVQNTKVH